MINGQTFDQVLHDVHSRAAHALPDAVVRIADLRMDPDGRLKAPGTPAWRLNNWSRRQFASLLGIRWDRWFEGATDVERAEEVNRRLSRLPGERKVRSVRDHTGAADGVARAFLPPAMTPIDDVRIFSRMATTLRGALDAYRFHRVVTTDTTSQYTAVHVDAVDLRGDTLHPGWTLRNSEVGGAPFTADDFWFRLACKNGLLVEAGGKRLLYRTHRTIDDDQLTAVIVVALSRLPERWEATRRLLEESLRDEIDHPDVEVDSALASTLIPREVMEQARIAALQSNARTRYGVAQSITLVAHTANKDPEIQFRMEQAAGKYLLAS